MSHEEGNNRAWYVLIILLALAIIAVAVVSSDPLWLQARPARTVYTNTTLSPSSFDQVFTIPITRWWVNLKLGFNHAIDIMRPSAWR